MSWSVNAIGKPSKVAAKLKAEFEKMTYLSKPEDEIAAAIGQAIIKAVIDTTDAAAVRVEANGSMGTTNGNHTHSITVAVVPLHGFVD